MNTIKPNVGTSDRYIRISIGAMAFVAGFFWLSGIAQIVAYSSGALALATGFFAYCGLYSLCGKSTCQTALPKRVDGKTTGTIIGLFIVLIAVGSYASIFVTKKIFLESFNHMNGFYKQTLFLTGQLKRDEAIEQYDLLTATYSDFFNTYAAYRPYVLKNDTEFSRDLRSVQQIILSARDGVYTGDLSQTHKKLESVRPIFQELFKRNGFSMVSMALVDFHDLMETMIAKADAKDADGVLASYIPASESLKIVEKEDASEGVINIRTALERLKYDAELKNTDTLSSDAEELKKRFIIVYLLKG